MQSMLARGAEIAEEYGVRFVVTPLTRENYRAVLAPLLGGLSHLVVARRLAFFSTTLGQAALTGLVIGVAVGQPLDETYTAILGFCLLVGVIMVYVRRQTTLPPDTVIAFAKSPHGQTTFRR